MTTCGILSLDGGGAKGFYTLGVLTELEAMLGKPLWQSFDLVFGTSTGSIIASLIALGRSVSEIHAIYKEHVPTVMRAGDSYAKTFTLREVGKTIFGDASFEQAKTALAIVAARWDDEKPMIFKSTDRLAHGRSATFVPGFGCSLADAVEASCSAYPFFRRKVLTTGSGERMELIDGGYCANNPTLFAIADAVRALSVHGFTVSAGVSSRILSVGGLVMPIVAGKRQMEVTTDARDVRCWLFGHAFVVEQLPELTLAV